MPRYFIDTSDGERRHHDSAGHDLPDAWAARRLAIGTLPGMAQDKLPDGDQRKFAVWVRDEAGTVLYTATLTLAGEWQVPPETS